MGDGVSVAVVEGVVAVVAGSVEPGCVGCVGGVEGVIAGSAAVAGLGELRRGDGVIAAARVDLDDAVQLGVGEVEGVA